MNVLSPYCTVTTSIYLYFSKLESRNETQTKAGKLNPKQLLFSRQQHTAPKNTPPDERGFCFLCVRGWFLLLYPPQGDPMPASRWGAEPGEKVPEGPRRFQKRRGSWGEHLASLGVGGTRCGALWHRMCRWAPWRWGGQLAGRFAALWGASRVGMASGEAQPQREPRNPGGLCGVGSGAGSGAARPSERATARLGAQQKKQDKSYLGLLYFIFFKACTEQLSFFIATTHSLTADILMMIRGCQTC